MLSPQVRRGDIQGLRALAVLLVVAGHLYPATIPGGFIGVDIFFVISGFVITRQMLDLEVRYPKQFLVHFYARRIRRILPSALLVLLITFIATKRYLGIVAENDLSLDGFWATLFLSNFHFQSIALNYFAAGSQVSPIQHFWSLSIEEQFYLFWPILFIALGIFKFLRLSRKFLLGTLTVLSLATAIYLSELGKGAIFFSSFPRVWELAAGALCALVAWRKSSNLILEITAVALLIATTLMVHQSMQWPRVICVPVVLLTCFLLSRRVPDGSTTLLKNPVSTYIGNLSYLIYLWHWPILVIVKAIHPTFGAAQIALVLAITAAVSVLTHHLFEDPIRRSDLLVRRPLITIFSGLTVVAIVATAFYLHYQG